MKSVLGVWACVAAHLGLEAMRRRGVGVTPPLGHRRREGPGYHPALSPEWSWIHSTGITAMASTDTLEKPSRPMRIDDVLFALTRKGFIKGADMQPPDQDGICKVQGPEDGIAHWRTRATWQQLHGDQDYVSIYPCGPRDQSGDTFIFVLYNPKNGVVEEWRIAEHWTGDDFVVAGCETLEHALVVHDSWLTQVSTDFG